MGGKLYFRWGTMNSSKTAQLIMVNHNYKEQGKLVTLFKPEVDNRDGEYIKSRAFDNKINPIIISKYDNGVMYNTVSKNIPDCVLVDEAQFLNEKQVMELSRIVDELNVPVICYGLLTDFKGKLFEGSKRLIEIADKKEEIKTVCYYCNKKALFNMRLFNGRPIFHGQTIKIGGNESYKPVCRKCYSDRYNKAKDGD